VGIWLYQEYQTGKETAARFGLPAGAAVFPSRREDGPLDQPQAWRLVRAAAARVGLPTGKGGVSPHWLRHAHATHALEHGHAPIHLVPATLGHASVATTSKYLHARPTDSSARYLGV
jgi:integrase/recombinase XerD